MDDRRTVFLTSSADAQCYSASRPDTRGDSRYVVGSRIPADFSEGYRLSPSRPWQVRDRGNAYAAPGGRPARRASRSFHSSSRSRSRSFTSPPGVSRSRSPRRSPKGYSRSPRSRSYYDRTGYSRGRSRSGGWQSRYNISSMVTRRKEGEYFGSQRRSQSPLMEFGQYVSPGRSPSPRPKARRDIDWQKHDYGMPDSGERRRRMDQCDRSPRSSERGSTDCRPYYQEDPYREGGAREFNEGEHRSDRYRERSRGIRRRSRDLSSPRDHSRGRDSSGERYGSGRRSRRQYEGRDEGRDDGRGSRRGWIDDDFHETRMGRSRERRRSRGDRSDFGEVRKILTGKRDGHGDSGPPPSNTVTVHNIPEDYTEDQVEDCVRTISIQKGFSMPESLWLVRSNSGSQSRQHAGVAAVLEEGELPMMTEVVAYVQFPSVDAASRFIKSCTNKRLSVANRKCPVEFAPSTNSYGGGSTAVVSAEEPSGFTTSRVHNRDWICLQCSYTNFSRRTHCLTCRTPRGSACTAPMSSRPAPTNPVDPVVCAPAGDFSASHLAGSMFPWSGATIIVNNVHERSTTDSIREAFSTMGPVKDVRLVQPTSKSSSSREEKSENHSRSTSTTLQSLSEVSKKDAPVGSGGKVEAGGGNPTEKPPYFVVEFPTENDALRAIQRFESAGSVIDGKRVKLQYCRSSGSQQFSHEPGSRSKDIHLPKGLPDISELTLDSISGYLYNRHLNLYYDKNTDLYMNQCGDYFRWTPKSSTLTNIYTLVQVGEREESERAVAATGGSGTAASDVQLPELSIPPTTSSASAVASLVEAAQQTAKASKKAVKVMPTEGATPDAAGGSGTGGSSVAAPTQGGGSEAPTVVTGTNSSSIVSKFTKRVPPNPLSVFSSSFGSDGPSDIEEDIAVTNRVFRPGQQNGAVLPKTSAGGRSTRTGLPSGLHCEVSRARTARRHGYPVSPPLPGSKMPGTGATTARMLAETRGKCHPAEKAEPKEFICYLCIRKFASAEMLKKHEDLSALHKKNLLAQETENTVVKTSRG